MKILVIGASGGTGRQVVTQALERGVQVTAFVRNARRLKLTHPRLRVVVGDVTDADSVDRAVCGQDVVVCVLGHKRWFYPNAILSDGTRHVIEAMRRQGVQRLVCQSSLGVGDSFGRLGLYYTLFVVPFILPLYFWDKSRQERVVRHSGLDWTIVRPGVLTNGKLRGECRKGRALGSWIRSVRISRADVARELLGLANSRSHVRETLALAY